MPESSPQSFGNFCKRLTWNWWWANVFPAGELFLSKAFRPTYNKQALYFGSSSAKLRAQRSWPALLPSFPGGHRTPQQSPGNKPPLSVSALPGEKGQRSQGAGFQLGVHRTLLQGTLPRAGGAVSSVCKELDRQLTVVE